MAWGEYRKEVVNRFYTLWGEAMCTCLIYDLDAALDDITQRIIKELSGYIDEYMEYYSGYFSPASLLEELTITAFVDYSAGVQSPHGLTMKKKALLRNVREWVRERCKEAKSSYLTNMGYPPVDGVQPDNIPITNHIDKSVYPNVKRMDRTPDYLESKYE